MAALLTQGNPVTVFEAAESSGVAEINCHGYTALMLIHEISDDAVTGGYAKIELRPFPGVEGQPHPAEDGDSAWGLNVVSAAQTKTYVSIYRGVTSRVGVKLEVTDGKHTVIAIPCHV